MTGIKVGDEVLVQTRGHRGYVVEQHAVTKVGRRYFYTQDRTATWRTGAFEIDTGVAKDGYGERAYTPEQWADNQRRKLAEKRLREMGIDIAYRSPFGSAGCRLSTNALGRIVAALEVELPPAEAAR